jgi:hypothetical protein
VGTRPEIKCFHFIIRAGILHVVREHGKSKKSVKPYPALKRLKVFVGDWDMELSRASFLPDPKTKIMIKPNHKQDDHDRGDDVSPPVMSWWKRNRLLYWDCRGYP